MTTPPVDARPAAPSAPPAQAGRLARLALATLLPALAVSSAHMALPALARAFGVGLAGVQWVVLAYLLATTALVVVAGRLGDLLGRRRLLLAGTALFTLASGGCAVAPTMGWLVAARALQGVGAAAMLALPLALVSVAVPQARAGRALGLLASMSAVGTALGPSLGGLALAAAGWPAVFAVNLPLGGLALALAWRCLPADAAREPAPRLDMAGLVWLVLTLCAYALGLARHAGLLGVAALGLGLLLRAESRAQAPLLPLARLRGPALATALAMNALVSAVMMATLVIGPFHLGGTLGLGAAAVGGLMSLGPVAAALSGVPAGRLVDRFGSRPLLRAGLVAVALGCAAVALLPASLGAVAYVGPLLLVTPGYALFQAANGTAVLAGAAGSERGVVSGLLTLARNLGLITGASAMAALYAAQGLRPSFGMAALLAAVALALSHKSAPGRG